MLRTSLLVAAVIALTPVVALADGGSVATSAQAVATGSDQTPAKPAAVAKTHKVTHRKVQKPKADAKAPAPVTPATTKP
jgi:hypothetical protein